MKLRRLFQLIFMIKCSTCFLNSYKGIKGHKFGEGVFEHLFPGTVVGIAVVFRVGHGRSSGVTNGHLHVFIDASTVVKKNKGGSPFCFHILSITHAFHIPTLLLGEGKSLSRHALTRSASSP